MRTGVREQARELHMAVDRQRVQRNDASGQRERFIDPPVGRGEPARGMQSRCVAGCQLDRFPERRVGPLPVEVVRREDLPQRDEPFDQIGRQGQRPIGLAADGERWVRCRPGFFLPVRVLSRLVRRRFLEELDQVHRAGRLQFFGEYAALADERAFADWLAPLRVCEWVVYAKRPFAGPAAVLAYLSRYTHRVAISNQRLLALDERGVTFRWKDYRATGKTRALRALKVDAVSTSP